MASPCLPPALLQCLGKHQAPGLWDLRRGEVKNQRPTLQHHQLIHPQTLTEKAMPLVSIIYLPIYIHIPNLGRGTQAARAQPTSLVGVGGDGVSLIPNPAPTLPHSLTSCREPSKRCSALLDTPGVGVTCGSCPVRPVRCGPSLTGALK